MRTSKNAYCGIVALAVLCSAAVDRVVAQTTYSYTQNAGGTQSWTNGANWAGAAVPDPVAGDTISMALTQLAATDLNLEADRTFGNIMMDLQGFTSRLFTINSGYTVTLAGTTPTINVRPDAGTKLYMECIVAGSSGLKKTGGGELYLNNAGNTFSGGIDLAGGALAPAEDACLGDVGNSITVSGNSVLIPTSGQTYSRDVLINDGKLLVFNRKVSATISGAATGPGGISANPTGFGTLSLTLSSPSNTFSGPVTLGNDSAVNFTVNSLADSTNTITMKLSNKGNTSFILGAGAVAPITLASRPFILSGNQSTDHVIENSSTNAGNTLTITKDFTVTSTRARDLVLQGVNTGDNTIGGCIPDGVGGATTLKKQQAGTWVLSGKSTFTGGTMVSGGMLALAGSSCLLDSGTLSISGGKLRLDEGVKERIDNLVLGGITQTTNTSYGSLSSTAKIKSDTYFAGTGRLFLGVDPPSDATVLSIR